jgi:hypothetical protein
MLPTDLKIKLPKSRKFPLWSGEDNFDFTIGLFELSKPDQSFRV